MENQEKNDNNNLNQDNEDKKNENKNEEKKNNENEENKNNENENNKNNENEENKNNENEKRESVITIDKRDSIVNGEKNNEAPKSPSILKKNIRKNSIIPRRFSLTEKFQSLQDMPKSKYNSEEEVKEILEIIETKYFERTEKDNHKLLTFLLKTNIKDKLRSDLLESNITVEKLVDLIGESITVQIFNKNDNIYIIDEKAEFIYILIKGNIGLYKIETYDEYMTFEQYLNYLYYEKIKNDNNNKSNEIDNGETKKEFIDDYLLMNILEENKASYHIRKLSDVLDFQEILFLIKIYKDCQDNNGGDIMNIYNSYNFPFTKYNYDNVINGKILLSKFGNHLTKFMKKRDYFYLQQYNISKNPIKIMKYERIDFLGENDYFGNFEILENKPLRIDTARCESSKALVFAINKKQYSTVLYKEQKARRERELEKYHISYIFKELNKNFFAQKIFTQFKIIDLLVGNELFKEDEYMENFYIIKEGTLEISINNQSINDLKDTINKLYDLIKKDVYMEINLKDTISFAYNTIKKSLNQKRKFLVFTSEKGLFGDYEKYFNMPSLFTATVYSKEVKLYLYSFEKYNHLYKEVDGLKESLKESAIKKVKQIIERLISIYNSYIAKIENEYTIIQQEQNDEMLEKDNKINKKQILKSSFFNETMKNLSKHIKNNSNYIEYNNDIMTDLKYVVPMNIIKQWKKKSNQKIKNEIYEGNNNSTLKDYYNMTTMYKSTNLRRRPNKIFLPSIVSNNSSNNQSFNKTEFNSTRNTKENKIKLKKDPLFININNYRIKFPIRIERNCPLINRIKKEKKKEEENKLKKNLKKKTINIIVNDNDEKKIKNIYKVEDSNVAGVQQFFNEYKDGKITIK